MDVKEFIGSTIKTFETPEFELLKERIVGEYITFPFVDEKLINTDILAEKVFDYFEKVELKTGDNFTKLCEKYASDWESVVRKYMPKEPTAKKGEPLPPMPRSLKYFKHAKEIGKSRSITMRQLADLARIMMSLYMGCINNEMKDTNEFEFSTEYLEIDKIISSLKSEDTSALLPVGKKKLQFEIKELYCADTAFFIMTMIMFYYIKSKEIKGED